ncbi:hypothetical protein A1355_18910 [Methylomonas koyamae]|uniref:Uncharacterized protein n=1 Tax=Methylomonas koyamae TaxID=702114 RepID=A0A177P7Q0_9GAMM|nr:hypothetical protein A1355_18910 [Methylomonas koyamae]
MMSSELIKGELLPNQQETVLKLIGDIQAQLPFLIDLSIDPKRSNHKTQCFSGNNQRRHSNTSEIVHYQEEMLEC